DRMFDAMGLLRGHLNSVLDERDWTRTHGNRWALTHNYPRTNLFDKGDSFELVAEVPGISKDDLNIKIQGNYLEISGERKVAAPEGYKIHRRERSGASFTRSLTLPADIDSEKVKANLKDGLLVLHLPKSEAAKPRLISIK
ncbi:MAG: Hsp20/alpha crystallin family protein, partial [Desulfobulbaceae bacterium]